MWLSKYLSFSLLCIIFFLTSHQFKDKKTFQKNEAYKIKAVLIEKFTRFIEWPTEFEKENTDFFSIKVIGRTPFYATLSNIYKDVPIKNRPVKIQYIDSPKDIGNCHVLFIAEIDNKLLQEVLQTIKKRPMLTISDSNGFAQQGTMINFYIKNDNRIHYEINISSINQIDLKVNFRLLEAGKIVKDKDN